RFFHWHLIRDTSGPSKTLVVHFPVLISQLYWCSSLATFLRGSINMPPNE
ncbi:hypothetical protein VCHENC02_4394B, partial [Vibrio harveyi]